MEKLNNAAYRLFPASQMRLLADAGHIWALFWVCSIAVGYTVDLDQAVSAMQLPSTCGYQDHDAFCCFSLSFVVRLEGTSIMIHVHPVGAVGQIRCAAMVGSQMSSHLRHLMIITYTSPRQNDEAPPIRLKRGRYRAARVPVPLATVTYQHSEAL